MQNNYSQYDIKKSIKRGCIYLLIALPFMLVIATVLTIIKAPYWLIMLATIVVGGGVVLISLIVNNKLEEKRKNKEKDADKFDPFRD